jgi:AraC family transcriptional regulator of adaptative response/methylated-DNA-[protein]-cysteine methyltransferase
MSRCVIEYTCLGSSLGSLVVAATERGVCCIRFVTDPVAGTVADASLLSALEGEFPFAIVRRNDLAMERHRRALSDWIEGRSDRLDLPLDVAGSRFQRRVWDALRQIPQGTTVTYGELADRIGVPRGARAVAAACAANPAAIAIPCHRVVPATGGVGGYRWGTERKFAMLAREGALASPARPKRSA